MSAVMPKRPAPRLPARASQRRAALPIDLAEWPLRMLMVEQCRSGTGWATYYRGTRAELQAAGVPAEAFPNSGRPLRFDIQTINVCSSGRREKLSGTMTAVETGFEMAVHWACMPYLQAAHPALAELARLLLIDASAWVGLPRNWGEPDSDEAPVARLAADPRTDYKPAELPRLRYSPEFKCMLRDAVSAIHQLVHRHGEIMPVEVEAQKAESRGLRLVKGGAA